MPSGLKLKPIIDALETKLSSTAVVDIYTSEPTDESILTHVNGTLSPYLVFDVTPAGRSKRGAGIVGYSKDPHIGTFSITAVAVNSDEAQELADIVTEAIVDWNAEGTSAFELVGSISTDNSNSSVKPTKFYQHLLFRFIYNL